jgi:hypothetical protein
MASFLIPFNLFQTCDAERQDKKMWYCVFKTEKKTIIIEQTHRPT